MRKHTHAWKPKANTPTCTNAQNKQFVWYCSKCKGLLRMRCKQAELRPDLSYNSSRNRSGPLIPHTRVERAVGGWTEPGASESVEEKAREPDVWEGSEDGSGSKVEVGMRCLGFQHYLSDRRWGWWGERDHRSRFEYINLWNAKLVRKIKDFAFLKAVRSEGFESFSSVLAVACFKLPHRRCHRSRTIQTVNITC